MASPSRLCLDLTEPPDNAIELSLSQPATGRLSRLFLGTLKECQPQAPLPFRHSRSVRLRHAPKTIVQVAQGRHLVHACAADRLRRL